MSNKIVLENPMRSLWLKDGIGVELESLGENLKTEVVVIGAGITGITTAYLLQKQGRDVVLIDRSTPFNLATGNTTAKFTFQHSLIIQGIIDNYGVEPAKYFYKAQKQGMKLVKDIIEQHEIDCDFMETFACVYGEDEKDVKALKKEQEAYEKIDVKSELTEEDPLKIGYRAALRVEDQFELNPVKYLKFMMNYLLKNQVRIYRDTRAVDISGEGPYTVETKEGYQLETEKVVVATGYPFFDAGSNYYSRLKPLRSYLTAFRAENFSEGDGMYLSMEKIDPYSLRFSETDGQRYLLVGGQGHKVGQRKSEMEDYKALIDFAVKHFNVKDAAYRWSAQDYQTMDKIPFIGGISSDYPGIYLGTGYNKWGMASGSFAALMISTLIGEGKEITEEAISQQDMKHYRKLFDPSRKEVTANMGEFLKTNMNVGKEMLKSKFSSSDIDISDLKPNQGAILKKDGEKMAAFKDAAGKVHTHSATCPHMGCDLEYNDAEKSFDCPCHGSRFTYDGKAIEGPAVKDLERPDKD